MPRVVSDLSCGARLLVSPRPGAPVCSLRVHVRGGPALDPPAKAGLAYLTGALVDQGTASHTEEQLAQALEPAGGEVHGDASGISGSIAGEHWKLLCERVSEMVLEPRYPKREFERQKERLTSRMLIEQEDPRVMASRRFRRLIYGDHWLGRPVHGDLESVAEIRASDLRRHHARHWVGRRLLIGVCGDVDPRAVKRVFERALAGLEPGTPYEMREDRLPRPGTRVGVFRASRAQVHLYLGHLGIRRNDPDYPALVVMDHVLGTGPGFTNRISRRLRDELGLAYSVHADIHSSAGLRPGTFTAYIGTSPDKVETALGGLLHEMRRVQAQPVEEQELEMAKSYLVGSFCLGFERASRRAAYLVASEVFGLPEDNLERMPQKFAAVTAADVQRVARQHLKPDACSLAAAGPVSAKELGRLLAGFQTTSSNGRSRQGRGASKLMPKPRSTKGGSPKRATGS